MTQHEVLHQAAQQLTDVWVRLFKPTLGYDRTTKTVLPAARENPLYKHNQEWLHHCLERGGYTYNEIEEMLKQAKKDKAYIQMVQSLVKLPNPKGVLVIDPADGYVHPSLRNEKGEPIQRIAMATLLRLVLHRAKLIRESKPLPDYLLNREMGGLCYLLQAYSVDEVLYMAEVAGSREHPPSALIDLPRYLVDARTRIELKRDMTADILRTLRMTQGLSNLPEHGLEDLP